MAEGVSFGHIPIGSLEKLIEQNHVLFFEKAPFTMAYLGASVMRKFYPKWTYAEFFRKHMEKDQPDVWARYWADQLPELVWIMRQDWMKKHRPEYEKTYWGLIIVTEEMWYNATAEMVFKESISESHL